MSRLRPGLLILVVLVLAGCGGGRAEPTALPPSPSPIPAATSAPTISSSPTPEPAPTATPGVVASPTPRETAGQTANSSAAGAPVSVPILGDQLAPGWDTSHGWSTGLQPGQEHGPQGAPVYQATFYGDSSGLFLTVKQDSPVKHLTANTVAVRVWMNPGASDLAADHVKVAVLSSDRYAYWDMAEAPVPFDAAATASEIALPAPKGVLPANTWTQVEIRFDQLPSPPKGRYLTGLYFKTEHIPNQVILLSGLELLVTPGSATPAAQVAATDSAQPTDVAPSTTGAPLVDGAPSADGGVLQVKVDLAHPAHPISPYIYGMAGSTPEYMKSLRPRLTNWGGNPTTRYNWELGNAFNAGSDWEYRNTDYGNDAGSVSDKFIQDAQAVGADVRITLPTIGWVAKNTDSNTCSFVGKDGKCYNPGANCQKPGAQADPKKANLPVDANWVVRWVKHMLDAPATGGKGFNVRFFAFDNEPDLWGFTHYDVHPNCTTYDEILDKYLTYATAVRAAAPKAELLGPVSCCWYFYWNSAAGSADKAKHDNQDFLPWFLAQVRQHDKKAGVRTLDALDIHYYPEGVYNEKADPATAAARLEATRGLWDGGYVDPSWIGQAVNLIPRMRQIIADNYPGTKLFISEWNFGGEKSLSGALAIADVLGIFGQEDLYAASYYRSPELNSPGFFGFKMYTNYDDQGGRFGDTMLPASSTNRQQLAAYASRDGATGKITVMLINKLPDRPLPIALQLDGLTGTGQAQLFRYSQDHPQGIVRENTSLTAHSSLTLPPYSITLLVAPLGGGPQGGK